MITGLQPSRPKPPQQSARTTLNYQQTRAAHEASNSPQTPKSTLIASKKRPQNQIEAMPPLSRPASSFLPTPALYDSATRHPVFFTQNLRKLPFTIPQKAGEWWSPVASGYILDQKNMGTGEPRTKL